MLNSTANTDSEVSRGQHVSSIGLFCTEQRRLRESLMTVYFLVALQLPHGPTAPLGDTQLLIAASQSLLHLSYSRQRPSSTTSIPSCLQRALQHLCSSPSGRCLCFPDSNAGKNVTNVVLLTHTPVTYPYQTTVLCQNQIPIRTADLPMVAPSHFCVCCQAAITLNSLRMLVLHWLCSHISEQEDLMWHPNSPQKRVSAGFVKVSGRKERATRARAQGVCKECKEALRYFSIRLQVK